MIFYLLAIKNAWPINAINQYSLVFITIIVEIINHFLHTTVYIVSGIGFRDGGKGETHIQLLWGE